MMLSGLFSKNWSLKCIQTKINIHPLALRYCLLLFYCPLGNEIKQRHPTKLTKVIPFKSYIHSQRCKVFWTGIFLIYALPPPPNHPQNGTEIFLLVFNSQLLKRVPAVLCLGPLREGFNIPSRGNFLLRLTFFRQVFGHQLSVKGGRGVPPLSVNFFH